MWVVELLGARAHDGHHELVLQLGVDELQALGAVHQRPPCVAGDTSISPP